MAPCLRACALRQRPGGPSTGRSVDRAGAMNQPLRWFDGVHPAAALWPEPRQGLPRKPPIPPGPAPGRHASSSLDLARAKSSRACPSGGRRVRARPVRRGQISQPLRKRIAPCLRACALRQRPGGPSTGRSVDRAGAMNQPLRWFDGVHPAAALWPEPRQGLPRKPPIPPGPAPGRHASSSLDLARAKSSRACPSGGRRVRARPVRRGQISQPLRKRIAPCLRACALRQRPGGPSTGRSADRAGGDETGVAPGKQGSPHHFSQSLSKPSKSAPLPAAAQAGQGRA